MVHVPADACCDVVCTSIEKTEDGRIKCGTGIHVALEDRDSLTIRPNSRITKAGFVIANSPCTVDESYRGEIFIVFRAIVDNPTPINVGDVIGQIEIPHHRQANFEVVKTLEDLGITDRGAGCGCDDAQNGWFRDGAPYPQDGFPYPCAFPHGSFGGE